MNFVVTFILGVIVVGATMWRMSRDGQDEAEDSNDAQATRIEVVNGADEEVAEEVIEVVAEKAANEPESIEIVEIDSDEADHDNDEEAETPIETLQQIIGIGPTYGGRIYDAGITSIEELAALSAEDLQQIVTPGKSTPTAETENWLEQARQLAGA